MRVVLAPDSFGGTLTAVQAAEAVAAGWRQVAPDDVLDLVPLSDGGPGFVDVLASALDGERVEVIVEDPLGRPVRAAFLLSAGTAYVEAAQACGLHLLGPAERDPQRTSTYGVGQLLRAALDAGAARVVVGVGGSGTNDGGAGALAALGVRELDTGGNPLRPGGAELTRLDRLDPAALDTRLHAGGVDLVLASDVDNPLLGAAGASAVYGPQKGATPADVAVLEAALARFALVLDRDLVTRGRQSAAVQSAAAQPGAGAAGGLGAALLALGAQRRSGIDAVLDALALDARIAAADLVVTGEGSYDWQSLRGKVVSGVARAAVTAGVPCIVLAGQVQVGRRESAAAGIDAAYAVADAAGSVEAALARPAQELRALAAQVARQWSRPGSAAR